MWLLMVMLREANEQKGLVWITVLSGKQTRRLVVVGFRLFKILVSLSRMWFLVVFVLYLRVIVLVYLLINALRLY